MLPSSGSEQMEKMLHTLTRQLTWRSRGVTRARARGVTRAQARAVTRQRWMDRIISSTARLTLLMSIIRITMWAITAMHQAAM